MFFVNASMTMEVKAMAQALATVDDVVDAAL